MKRSYKKKRRRKAARIFLICFLALAALGAFFVSWALKPENLREQKNQLSGYLFRKSYEDAYYGKSLILEDCSDKSIVFSKKEEEPGRPASLAKLYVIEYASTLVELDSVVFVSREALALTKPDSSVADIKPGEYFVRDLIAAMLVPSGNDAAYALADYCGGILSPESAPGQERVDVFMEQLNRYLQDEGYQDTVLYDPSGFDEKAFTTVLDLSAVTNKLLKYSWFRDIVSQSVYTAELPDGTEQTWKNTNAFLDPESEYYNPNVIGVKTGSMSEAYNLVALYRRHGKEFLICSLGSQSDSQRYKDIGAVLRAVDESDYLAK